MYLFLFVAGCGTITMQPGLCVLPGCALAVHVVQTRAAFLSFSLRTVRTFCFPNSFLLTFHQVKLWIFEIAYCSHASVYVPLSCFAFTDLKSPRSNLSYMIKPLSFVWPLDSRGRLFVNADLYSIRTDCLALPCVPL